MSSFSPLARILTAESPLNRALTTLRAFSLGNSNKDVSTALFKVLSLPPSTFGRKLTLASLSDFWNKYEISTLSLICPWVYW